jgi:hypothetical protein
METAVGVASDELMDDPGVVTGGASWVNAAQGTTTGVAQVASEQDEARVHRASKNRRSEAAAQASGSDCPLTCCTAAIAASMPRSLAALEAEDMATTRVWTTLLCIAVLERMSTCWIHGDGNVYAERERTIVDHAREWVERYAAERPALALALANGMLAKHATHTTLLWHRACEQRVAELRRSEGITAQARARARRHAA